MNLSFGKSFVAQIDTKQLYIYMFSGTIYPGLMITSATLYRLAWWLNITIDIRNVCVFLAPLFSSFTTIVTYLLTKELRVQNYNCIIVLQIL